MGLDMYVFAFKKGDNPNESNHVGNEIAYWRKANSVHSWFVKNFQERIDDCSFHKPLTKEMIVDLVHDCAKEKENPTGTYLEPTSGFFFGSTEIDDWFIRDMQDTENQMTVLLNSWDDTLDYYYLSSW